MDHTRQIRSSKQKVNMKRIILGAAEIDISLMSRKARPNSGRRFHFL